MSHRKRLLHSQSFIFRTPFLAAVFVLMFSVGFVIADGHHASQKKTEAYVEPTTSREGYFNHLYPFLENEATVRDTKKRTRLGHEVGNLELGVDQETLGLWLREELAARDKEYRAKAEELRVKREAFVAAYKSEHSKPTQVPEELRDNPKVAAKVKYYGKSREDMLLSNEALNKFQSTPEGDRLSREAVGTLKMHDLIQRQVKSFNTCRRVVAQHGQVKGTLAAPPDWTLNCITFAPGKMESNLEDNMVPVGMATQSLKSAFVVHSITGRDEGYLHLVLNHEVGHAWSSRLTDKERHTFAQALEQKTFSSGSYAEQPTEVFAQIYSKCLGVEEPKEGQKHLNKCSLIPQDLRERKSADEETALDGMVRRLREVS